jgi:hypothetical protein
MTQPLPTLYQVKAKLFSWGTSESSVNLEMLGRVPAYVTSELNRIANRSFIQSVNRYSWEQQSKLLARQAHHFILFWVVPPVPPTSWRYRMQSPL